MPYPHGSDCRCPPLPQDAGLLAFTQDCDHHQQLTAALERIAGKPTGATLRVLTTDPKPATNLVALPSDVKNCDGSYLCECSRCSAEKAALIKRGVRPSTAIPTRKAA